MLRQHATALSRETSGSTVSFPHWHMSSSVHLLPILPQSKRAALVIKLDRAALGTFAKVKRDFTSLFKRVLRRRDVLVFT